MTVAQEDPMWVKLSNNQLLPDMYVSGDVVRCNEVFGDWVVGNGFGVKVNEDGSAIGGTIPAAGMTHPAGDHPAAGTVT